MYKTYKSGRLMATDKTLTAQQIKDRQDGDYVVKLDGRVVPKKGEKRR